MDPVQRARRSAHRYPTSVGLALLLCVPFALLSACSDSATILGSVTVSTATGPTTEASGQASFTIVLDIPPSAEISFSVNSSDSAEGIVSVSTVTFTPQNWNAPQTITVTGVDDDIADGDQPFDVVFSNTTTVDTAYAEVTPDSVSFTNTDDDSAGIMVSPVNGATTEAGGEATFTLVLNSQPTADVTIALGSSDPGEGTPTAASVTFTPSNWDAPQTVTVSGVDDDEQDGEQTYEIDFTEVASSDGNYSALEPRSVSLRNIDDDSAGVTVGAVLGAATEAGAQAAFTVVLNSTPTADVTLTLQSSDADEGTVAPTSLVFTADNWNAPQTVTVSGVDDDLADGNQPFSVVVSLVESDDGQYDGLAVPNIPLTNIDDETAAILVSAVSGPTTEGGGQADFSLVLTSQPTADVTVSLAIDDEGEGSLSSGSVTFTVDDWDAPHLLTVSGVNDDLADGNQLYSVMFTGVSSADASYAALTLPNLLLTNIDDETAGLEVGAASGPTTEAAGSATFTVVLLTQPTAEVRIALQSSDTTEGSVAPAELVFTSETWDDPQTVQVTGANDDLADGNQPYSVGLSVTSDDSDYQGESDSVALTNIDDETAGVRISPVSGPTSEGGGTATFAAVLTSQPTANVVIDLLSGDTDEASLSSDKLTFTPDNWDLAQTVTARGEDDDLADGNQLVAVALTVSSADGAYQGYALPNLLLTNLDDDRAGISVTAPANATSEGGAPATFTVVLDAQPTHEVTINLQSNDTTEGRVSPAQLIFSGSNWNQARTVTVTGEDDALLDGAIQYAVVFSPAISSDPDFSGLTPGPVLLRNIDDETAGIAVGAPSGGTTSEAGGKVTFTVVLTIQPRADVVIALATDDASEASAAPASLTFTPGTWDSAQTVTVSGLDERLVDGDQAYKVVFQPAASADPDYDGLTLDDIDLTNTDDDAGKILVSPPSGSTSEGGAQATFSVVLGAQPTANVVVDLDSNDAGEGTVSATSLTFTPSNWNTAQIVTVTGVDDALVDGTVSYAVAFTAASSLDPAFDGLVPADVPLLNLDNDNNPIQLVLDAVERGWWRDNGSHSSGNNNTYTGATTSGLYNSYYIFDLSAVSGTVVGAELRLEVESWFGPDSSETISIWDVSTDANTLENGSNMVAVHTDLQTGHSYGQRVVQKTEVGSVVNTTLDLQAHTDINAALGGSFSLGVHVDTVTRSGTAEAMRFSSGSESRTHQLVLQVLP